MANRMLTKSLSSQNSSASNGSQISVETRMLWQKKKTGDRTRGRECYGKKGKLGIEQGATVGPLEAGE